MISGDERFASTTYFVDATDYERLALWRQYRSDTPWFEDPRGIGVQVGKVLDMPVFVSFTWATLHGQRVAFYEATSQVVDHRMVDEYLARVAPGVPKTDAMNFGHCLHACKAAAGVSYGGRG